MAGDYRLFDTISVEQTHDVADVMEHGVFLDFLGTVASARATQVGRHCAEPCLRECPELMPPGIPALGKAVAEDDEGARALFGHVYSDAVRFDHAMRHLGHRRIHPRWRIRARCAWLGRGGLERLGQGGAD